MKSVCLTSKDNEEAFVYFDIIDITNNSEKLIKKLSIIRGDIYDVCKNVTTQVIVIFNFNEYRIKECVDMVENYRNTVLNSDENFTPIFLVIGADYQDVNNIIGIYASIGFKTGDHLVNLGNNFVMVKTSYKKYKELAFNYFQTTYNFYKNSNLL